MISLIVAHDLERGIGYKNKLPWHIPDDLKRFKKITLGKAILMGNKTYQSIGKPLPDRTNIVLTRQKDYSLPGVKVINDCQQIIETYDDSDQELLVIGGASIYRIFLPWVKKLYISEVQDKFDVDRFFSEIDTTRFDLQEEKKIDSVPKYVFKILTRKKD
ncbi:MAG: dihydrofolate reductase [SAR324 cluster bacterium]|nr:dihydrofolate reductase [SAR324 cluster bacterium]